jgi:hypothetical protein
MGGSGGGTSAGGGGASGAGASGRGGMSQGRDGGSYTRDILGQGGRSVSQGVRATVPLSNELGWECPSPCRGR